MADGVALFTHQAGLLHDTGPHHPECADRLRAVLQALEHPDFVPLLRETAPEASRTDLERAHPAAYVDRILAVQGQSRMLDADTIVSPGSVEAALRGAGAAAAAVDAVLDGWARAAFVAMRPPGHHAGMRGACAIIAYAFAGFGGRQYLGAPAACAGLVDPGVANDRIEPRVQPGSFLELVKAHERALDGNLNDIVGIRGLARERTGEAAKTRQHLDDAGAGALICSRHLSEP